MAQQKNLIQSSLQSAFVYASLSLVVLLAPIRQAGAQNAAGTDAPNAPSPTPESMQAVSPSTSQGPASQGAASTSADSVAAGQTAASQTATSQTDAAQSGSLPVITLDEAIRRAQTNDSAYINAVANRGLAAQDRTIARSALLPSAIYHNQYLYTQPQLLAAGSRPISNGQTVAPVRFIANNVVHEYISQVQVNETLGFNLFAQYQRAHAALALATAQQEIARRDLAVSVVNAYFSALASAGKLVVAQRAAGEAEHFSGLTRKLEAGREVAHADVVKADLQTQQRQRDLSDAELAAEKSRLDLGVLLFPDPRTGYTLADSLATNLMQPPPLQSQAEVEAAAQQNNPDLRAALEAVHVAQKDVSAARLAYLPQFGLNYSYGIDAAQFAASGPDGVRNLGYSMFATLDIPLWDWFATQARVRQADIRRDVAKIELTTAQKRLLADLQEFYNEAQSAGAQLASLNNSVAGAQDSLRLVNLRYTSGEATVLEVVDAQNTLTSTELLRADGVVRYRIALANLQTLTGKLP